MKNSKCEWLPPIVSPVAAALTKINMKIMRVACMARCTECRHTITVFRRTQSKRDAFRIVTLTRWLVNIDYIFTVRCKPNHRSWINTRCAHISFIFFVFLLSISLIRIRARISGFFSKSRIVRDIGRWVLLLLSGGNSSFFFFLHFINYKLTHTHTHAHKIQYEEVMLTNDSLKCNKQHQWMPSSVFIGHDATAEATRCRATQKTHFNDAKHCPPIAHHIPFRLNGRLAECWIELKTIAFNHIHRVTTILCPINQIVDCHAGHIYHFTGAMRLW